ncbi:molybdopterin-dependent oxidoreductase [Agrobacterium vitis]|uniref:molybdopterin-dependent oxidoreductase n=1 Tax=Agrobacterium vitis TaxID=373 RepID=UPI0012E72C79|nr:molybdopterin-dependent oxidoreductase [Agrobacterium vitis]MVA23848.1 molybdopterin-dependent oxidoreductase [Agrobacterium vitis]
MDRNGKPEFFPHSSHWGAFTVRTDDGKLSAIEPFAKDPFPSPMLRSIPEWVHHTTRIARPAIRKGWLDGDGGRGRGTDAFVEVDWNEALSAISNVLDNAITDHGNSSIFAGSYGWASAGRFHHPKTQLQRYLGLRGGYTGQIHSYSIAAGYAILPHVVGNTDSITRATTSWQSISAHTELFLAFGGLPLKNHQVVSGGPGAHSAEMWMRTARGNGVRFINISPLMSDAPEFLDAERIPIRPGSDTALMLALAYHLLKNNRQDDEFLARCTVGFEQFSSYLEGADGGCPRDADWAAGLTGIPAGRILRLAEEIAASRTLVSTNWSLQRADHGEQPFWMTIVLAAILGGIGLPGQGFAFGYGSIAGMGEPRTPIPAVSLKQGPNPAGSAIPVARIADMLLAPGSTYAFNGKSMTYPDIKVVYWCGGNPFHHHQDINRLIKAWKRPETVVVHDPWWSTVARYADIALPATTTLERNDIGSSSKDRFILAMKKAVEPVGEAKSDCDIFAGLARLSGHDLEFTQDRSEMQWLQSIYAEARKGAERHSVSLPDFDNFWKAGHVEITMPADDSVLFSDFRHDPEGSPLSTPSGRIEIFSETVAGFGYADCPGHPVWLAPKEWLGAGGSLDYPLHLVTNQPAHRLHSQMDQTSLSSAAKTKGRESVSIHPEDARKRRIRDGDIVRLFNSRGQILGAARVSDDVMPGVVQMATGAWYDPLDRDKENSLDKHGNPNVLTADHGTSQLGQGPSALSVTIDIEPWDKSLPAITAFDSPLFVAR